MKNPVGPQRVVPLKLSWLAVAVAALACKWVPATTEAQDDEAAPLETSAFEESSAETGAPPPPPANEETAPFAKKLSAGVGIRTGLQLKLADAGQDEIQMSLDDGLADQINIRPFMALAMTENVNVFIQFEIGTPTGLGISILDAMVQLKLMDEVQLWVGQHIPANDRNNMNGPFFGNTWSFAIAVPSYSFDSGARDRGATLWGILVDGLLKYHLSAVDLQPGQSVGNARLAGRLTLNLLDPENYYYASGSYWGSQDTLAVGAVVQHQLGEDRLSDPTDPTSATLTDTDFTAFSFDAFYEQALSIGTLTVEAAYWNWENVGSDYVSNQGTRDIGTGVVGPYPGSVQGSAYMGTLSYLTPRAYGPGKIQVNARAQVGQWEVSDTLTIDAGLAYVVDGFNHKYHLNYRHQEVDPAGAGGSYALDAVQVGMQFQMTN